MSRLFTLLLGLIGVSPWFAFRPPSPATREEPRPQFKSPLGVAVDEKGQRAFAALHTAGAVAVVDLKEGKVLHAIPVGPRPHAVLVEKGELLVTCEGTNSLVVLDLARRVVKVWSPLPPAGGVARANGEESYPPPTSIRGSTHSPDRESWLYVHQRPRTSIPSTQVLQGWVFTNALTISTPKPELVAVLDEPQRGFADPTDLAFSADGKRIFLCCAGADAVLVVDKDRLERYHQRRRRAAGGKPPAVDDLTASRHYVVARLPTQANPRRLALSGDGKTLVASNYLADSLTVIDATRLEVVRNISLGGPEPDAARRGEILFHSGKTTFLGQFTCASCHPDGGADGLNWDLTRDGVGTFKNTKSLLGAADTAPYGWLGTSPTLADRVAGTLRTLHRHEPTDAEINDLVAYLKCLPPPTPAAVKEEDRPAVERGRAVFQGKGDCVRCHSGPTFQDGRTHHVVAAEAVDTPSLRGLGGTAPYLHDGRAATLEDVFGKHNPRRLHGAAHRLTASELADLIAYLRSL